MNRPSDFVEAVVTLLPPEAGGRDGVISPRDGSYRPFLRVSGGGPTMRVRFIEGPPTLAPGDSDLVVLELEDAAADAFLISGAELDLLESGSRSVGVVTVARVWRGALAL